MWAAQNGLFGAVCVLGVSQVDEQVVRLLGSHDRHLEAEEDGQQAFEIGSGNEAPDINRWFTRFGVSMLGQVQSRST